MRIRVLASGAAVVAGPIFFPRPLQKVGLVAYRRRWVDVVDVYVCLMSGARTWVQV